MYLVIPVNDARHMDATGRAPAYGYEMAVGSPTRKLSFGIRVLRGRWLVGRRGCLVEKSGRRRGNGDEGVCGDDKSGYDAALRRDTCGTGSNAQQ